MSSTPQLDVGRRLHEATEALQDLRHAGDRAALELARRLDLALNDLHAMEHVMGHGDLGPAGGCMTLDPLACLGTSATRGLAAGALVSLSAGPEWLILVDARGGLDDTDATFGGAAVTWPRRYWLSAFARLQWRYR